MSARGFSGGLLASVLLASGSYYLIERPFLSLKQRFESAPPPPRSRRHRTVHKSSAR